MFFRKKQPVILMIEDNKLNHPLFEKAFEDAGFTVVLLRNAEGDFVETVLEIEPDIISMDIMIGKSGAFVTRGGLDAVELLKNDNRTKHIPVIMLSNFFEEGKVERAKELGAVDFLNLQGHAIPALPRIFKNHLKNPKGYVPTHPLFRE